MREQFEIDNLLPEHENSLREFLGGQNIFVNLPTGYGKSLIFRCLPIAADALFEKRFHCSLCNIAIAIAYGRSYSLAKPDRDKYDNRNKKQHNLQQLIKQPGPA